ncbi:MAG: deoxyuridine 5''-triphosphate nucleotidohydrolase [Candidatus Magasanikbacteria bacterium GW2011_GWC2_42_27]|nr:MAG: deoxyuridine 5''-triphosphate nucleotidohydrolase [Candidatus Magasanikbacteria bacterium GW2011_GWC2_42_27]
MNINIKKLHPEAKLPQYAHPGDVGMDMYTYVFECGFAMEFPIGYAAIVKDKGSVSKMGLHTFGGVYDAGYRGQYNAGIINHSGKEITVEKGQKIAQIVIFPVEIPTLKEVDELSESERGEGRYGSTGKF